MKTSRIDEVVSRMSAPSRPEPMTLRVRYFLTDHELEHARRDFDSWCMWLKSNMARQIASHIVENCGVLQVPNNYQSIRCDHDIEMELTINDASAYGRMLPAEHRRGVTEGRKIERAAAPYGLEPDTFYE